MDQVKPTPDNPQSPQDQELLIKPLTLSDLSGVLDIENQSFGEPWNRLMFREQFGKPYCLNLGCFSKNPLVVRGYLIGWLIFEEFHIANLAVDPDYRRCHIAANLVDQALQWARHKQAEFALLEVRSRNQPAVQLYLKFGFRQIFLRPNYYACPADDALVMRLEL